MRKALMGAVAMAACAGPALAMVEPVAVGKVAEVAPDPRDGRVRVVEYERGAVIRLLASRGKTLMVELPEGQEIDTFLASDQDVMENVVPEADQRDGVRNPNAPPAGPQGPQACSLSANLQVCVRRDRFISFKPITELDPQPVHVIALRMLPNGKIGEVPYIFQLETEGRGEKREQDGNVRMVGNAVPAPAAPAATSNYYAVRVEMPKPTPRPIVAPRPGRAPPSLARTQPQNLPAVAAQPAPPPPPVNSAYELQGDRGLVGAAR